MVTYDYYSTEYYGDSVDESSFEKWERRAVDKLKYLCSGNLTDEAIEQNEEKIKKAVCSLIDLLFQIDDATKSVNDPAKANIKSMSSGGQSVSFGNNDTLITKALSDKVAQNRLMIDAVVEYLNDTGLLYKGVL